MIGDEKRIEQRSDKAEKTFSVFSMFVNAVMKTNSCVWQRNHKICSQFSNWVKNHKETYMKGWVPKKKLKMMIVRK